MKLDIYHQCSTQMPLHDLFRGYLFLLGPPWRDGTVFTWRLRAQYLMEDIHHHGTKTGCFLRYTQRPGTQHIE